jgi:hypothetical protein
MTSKKHLTFQQLQVCPKSPDNHHVFVQEKKINTQIGKTLMVKSIKKCKFCGLKFNYLHLNKKLMR